MNNLEEQISHWREYVRRHRTIGSRDVAELEDHLRDAVGELTGAGLAGDEAFLIAVKRMGSLDSLSLEFAREHSDRLWKQLVIPADGRGRLLVLTTGGRKRLKAALPVWQRTHAEAERLVRSDAESLRAGLRALS